MKIKAFEIVTHRQDSVKEITAIKAAKINKIECMISPIQSPIGNKRHDTYISKKK